VKIGTSTGQDSIAEKLWQPVVDEDVAHDYLSKLSDIVAAVLALEADSSDVGLFGGKTGLALLLFYYEALANDEMYGDTALDMVSDVFDRVNDGYYYHTFATGTAGIGWAFDHLVRRDYIESEPDLILADLDPLLHRAMMLDIQEGRFDFLHGALGCGLYFLNRLGSGGAEDYLSELVPELEQVGTMDNYGRLAWESVVDIKKGTRGFNLSMSHGIASVIAFLGRIHQTGIERKAVSRMLESAIRYLLDQKLKHGDYISVFPPYVIPGEPPSDSRLAWCYGDLGIGAALYQAGVLTENSEWEEQALEILRHSAARRELEKNSVFDASLCHGAAGVAHIFNRMFQYSGVLEFKEASQYWLKQTMDFASFDDGIAGFKTWHGREADGNWVNDLHMLSGAAGVGLVLISAVSNIEPGWDQCLLLS
jgi:lantibiotic modifying enzyme